MNDRFAHLDRLEFAVTYACTGRCKHCSEGDRIGETAHLDATVAATVVRDLRTRYRLRSVMTFGGEPLLCPETVCAIHAAAREAAIPRREIITNGFFSKDPGRIRAVAHALCESGVNRLLLSVDAFHQETIPLSPVMAFAASVCETGISIVTHPAWLRGPADDNPYDRETAAILTRFRDMGIEASDGNMVFPAGNARRYLADYFDPTVKYENPYREDPNDIRAICIAPDGRVCDGCVYDQNILTVLDAHR